MGNKTLYKKGIKRGWIMGFIGVLFFFSGCFQHTSLNVYQKSTAIPDHAWDYDFEPNFTFDIVDTSARYDLYITLRHTNQYPYRNLWVLVRSAYEGEKPVKKRVELPLADKKGKWLGTGMGDIFSHRIPIQKDTHFDRAGAYHFSLEQNMRINPLPHVISVGLRIEKVTR